jgi:hypothetical protein
LENECSKNAQKLCSGKVVESLNLTLTAGLSNYQIRHENDDIFKNVLSKKGLE